MIVNGYTLSVKDIADLHKFKNNPAYSSYLRSISSSPIFKMMMNEHINNVDVSEDIKKLKDEGKLPDSISSDALSSLFKQSLERMAICITADSVILKELEDTTLQELKSSMKEDLDITYLLGLAEKKFYNQASKLLDAGKLDKNSLAFKGLVAYIKNNGKIDKEKVESISSLNVKEQKVISSTKPKNKKIDFDSNSIEL